MWPSERRREADEPLLLQRRQQLKAEVPPRDQVAGGGTGGGALALFDFSGYLLEGGNIMSGRACHFYCLELFPISVAEMMPA